MVSHEFISALLDVRHRLSAQQWGRLISAIEKQGDNAGELDAATLLPEILNSDVIWLLNQSFRLRGASTWAQLAAILATIDVWAESTTPKLDVVWSGPDNGLFPVRRFDQVLYDLVLEASKRILIVTFAAYHVERLCQHLAAARGRGASLTMILEAEEESGGQLSYDAMGAFESLAQGGCSVYYWPLEKRQRNAAGRPGKLHVKCAVVDSTVVVGSGNLTEHIFSKGQQ